MKIVLIVLACIGLALITLGTVLASFPTFTYITAPEEVWGRPGMYFEWMPMWYFLALLVALPGAILVLIGGLIARPRYLWIGLIVVGLAYCLIFLTGGAYVEFKQRAYPNLYAHSHIYTSTQIVLALLFLSPGLASIIEGVAIRKPRKRQGQTV
jgi:hypothetical protein